MVQTEEALLRCLVSCKKPQGLCLERLYNTIFRTGGMGTLSRSTCNDFPQKQILCCDCEVLGVDVSYEEVVRHGMTHETQPITARDPALPSYVRPMCHHKQAT